MTCKAAMDATHGNNLMAYIISKRFPDVPGPAHCDLALLKCLKGARKFQQDSSPNNIYWYLFNNQRYSTYGLSFVDVSLRRTHMDSFPGGKGNCASRRVFHLGLGSPCSYHGKY